MNKDDRKWIVAALVAPHIVFFLVAFIQSLVWPYYTDIPNLIDKLPIFLALIVMVYCLMGVNIGSSYIRLTAATTIVLLTLGAGFVNLVYSACIFWNECL